MTLILCASYFLYYIFQILKNKRLLYYCIDNYEVRDEDFYERGGPNPTWGGSSHGSYENTDKFWTVSGQRSPFWFPFRPIPRPQRQSPPKKKLLVGDQGYCGTGSCEFFLFCMLGGGVVESGCGGFLFACCHRPGQVGSDVIAQRVSTFV